MNDERNIVECLHRIVGTDGVVCGAAVRAFGIDGRVPHCVACPATLDELTRCVAAAHAAGLAMIPVGHGTRLGIGRAPAAYDVAMSTQRLRRVVAHEAADMTVTVEAGLTLADLNAALAAAEQWLPLDPPVPEHTSIGALIATDASGPQRLAHGRVRDLLIGITAVLADGTLVKGGGRVVKNVAGYDLMKLFTGSFGTLGIVADATFKIRPRPPATFVLVARGENIETAVALAHVVLDAPLSPSYVEVLNMPAGRAVGLEGAALVVGCGGPAHELAVQRDRLEHLLAGASRRVCSVEESARVYTALRDLPVDAGFTGTATISVSGSRLGRLLVDVERAAAERGLPVAILSHAGNGIAVVGVIGGAADPALPGFAEWLVENVRGACGWVRFDRVPAALAGRIDAWPMEPSGLQLMRGIKQTLDPQRRLSPGRFVGGI